MAPIHTGENAGMFVNVAVERIVFSARRVAELSLARKPLTWNESGGYWTPGAACIRMSVRGEAVPGR